MSFTKLAGAPRILSIEKRRQILSYSERKVGVGTHRQNKGVWRIFKRDCIADSTRFTLVRCPMWMGGKEAARKSDLEGDEQTEGDADQSRS